MSSSTFSTLDSPFGQMLHASRRRAQIACFLPKTAARNLVCAVALALATTWGARAAEPESSESAAESEGEGRRVSRGLLALYDFQATEGRLVKDRSGVSPPLDLRIANLRHVERAEGSLDVRGRTLISSEKAASKVVNAVRRSGALSVEAWLRPSDLKQSGPARIVTLSGNSSNRNFTLGQDGDRYDVRLRTTATSGNGLPSLASPARSVKQRLTHVVYVRSRDGQARLYLDGKPSAKKTIGGKLTNWDKSYRLALADEVSEGRPWLGRYHLVALYGRALSPNDVARNYRAGVDGKTGPAESAGGQTRSPQEIFFDEEIVPILSKHCLECHDTATREGKLDLSKKSRAYATSKGEAVIIPGQSAESLLWEVVESDEMPDERESLSAAEKTLLRKWIDDGAVWTTEEIDPLAHTFDRRAKVNLVRRLTVTEYIETIRAVTGVDISREAREILPRDIRADGFSNTAYNLSVDLKHVEAYGQLAGIVVSRMDATEFARRYAKNKKLALTDAVMRKLIAKMGRDVMRGDLDEAELSALRGITTTIASSGGTIEEALAMVLEAMLQSPRFLYRVENQRGDGDAWPVNEYELASRLSYSILGAAPDRELLELAESGALLSAEVLDAQVDRLLEDPRAVKRSIEFANDWLNLDRLANMRPNPERFPQWSPELGRDMQSETLAFFEEVVWEQKRPLADLLNAQVTFATPRLAKHYGLVVEREGLALYDLKSVGERGGLLTQGSVLTIGGDEASMVTRGLFVLHDLLRSGVKDPPPCVDTTPVATKPGLTQRSIAEDRVANRSCGGCHSKFEPLAYGLERFDGVGAYHRADEHGNPLREDGEVLFPGTAEPVPYETASQLMDLLASSDRVSQCLTWKVAQFAVGRPLGQPDALVVDKIHREAQKGGGTYASVIRAIIKSDLVQKTKTEADNEE